MVFGPSPKWECSACIGARHRRADPKVGFTAPLIVSGRRYLWRRDLEDLLDPLAAHSARTTRPLLPLNRPVRTGGLAT